MRTPPIIAVMLVACALTLAAAGPAAAQSAKTSLEGVQAERFNRISDRLVCQCGCDMILRVCNHFNCPSAVPMRKKIEEEILAGKSDDEIVQGFVAEMGAAVLSSPPPRGINLAAWVMPGFAVLVGLFLVFYFAADWVAKKKVEPRDGGAETETGAELDADVVMKIERELEESG